jgi:hypothetical protein
LIDKMSRTQNNHNSNQEYRNDFDELANKINAIITAFKNGIFTAPGLTIGTTAATKVKIANTVNYTVSGQMYTKATAEVALTATTHDIADGSEAYFYLTIDAAGTVTITKGTEATTASGGATLDWDEAGSGTLLGAVKLVISGAAFDATSDDLSAAHVTDTYIDAPSVINVDALSTFA